MAQRELTAADYLAMFRRHWVMILICTIVGGPLAYGVSRFLPVKYKSQTLVLIEQQSVPEKYVTSIDTSDISQRLCQHAAADSEPQPAGTDHPPVRSVLQSTRSKASMDDLVTRLQNGHRSNAGSPMAETRSRELPGFNIAVTCDSPAHRRKYARR